jgi:protein-S-isoprenylcysteine O-methyltransferase Ste14
MKALSLVGGALMVMNVFYIVILPWWKEVPIPEAGWVGTLFFVAALGLFWWAVRANKAKPLSVAYSRDSPQHLMQDGPYRLIRHPFYSSYCLCWIAGPIVAGQPLMWVAILLLFPFYFLAAKAEETKFLRSSLAEDYRLYKKRTGMFFPWIG